MPFGAHPKRDHCGNLWNIGISGDLLVLYVISPGGKPVSTTVHRVRPTALVHDFILTERYVGVWLAPLVLNLNDVDQGSSLLDAMTWASAQGSQLLLFNRQTQQIEHQLELEAELIFHFANAWEHNDSLVVQYVRSHPDVLRHQLMSKAAAVAQPMEGGTQLVKRRIELPSGVSTVHCGARQTEFPQIDLRFQGRASQVCFCLIGSAHDGAGDYNGLLREVANGGHRQVWFADVGIVLEEHVHVPEHDHSPEGAGWLIGSGFDRTRNQSFCSVFDAERLEDGPLAVAYLNGSAPMALHGEFVPLR